MAGVIRANIGGIDEIRSSISQQLGALREEEKKLQESIARLGSMWEGEAHNAFQADLQENYQRIGEIDKRLADVLGYEERSVSEYSKAEEEIDAKLSSME